MKNLVSVIIPTFNRAHTLVKTLSSVLRQTHQNWECLIIDDGSDDNTNQVISEFIHDGRFKYIKRNADQPKGAASCRNIGLEKAKGDYIQFLDSDDILAKTKFEYQLNLTHGENDLLTCKWGKIVLKNSTEEITIYENLPAYKNFKNSRKIFDVYANRFCYLPLHSFLIPSQICEGEKWNEHLTLNDDGDFMSRIIAKSETIKFCNTTYVLYRRGAGNRLSKSLDTKESYVKFILSWKLTEQTIGSGHLLMRISKFTLFDHTRKKFPELIKAHSSFLENRISSTEFRLRLYYSKILDKLFIRFRQLNENDLV